MKCLLFAGSLRKASLNKKLIKNVFTLLQDEISKEKNIVLSLDLLNFEDLNVPVYNEDLEDSKGIPEGIKLLNSKIKDADALIFSVPEYNSSTPGPFKNLIDWISRDKANPLKHKQILLLGASPGRFAAARGNLHTRVPITALETFIYPKYFGLGEADKQFDKYDLLTNELLKKQLKDTVSEFILHCKKASRRQVDQTKPESGNLNSPHVV